MKFSVIVPVYNVEKYLKRCLDSILNQDIDYSEYEIILINDGSTDSSLSICKKYENQYENVILISQENQGLSVARNNGLAIAKGKYIIFVDSDDYIEHNMFSLVFREMEEKNLDALSFDIAIYNTKDILLAVQKPGKFNPDEIMTGKNYMHQYGFFGVSKTAWAFIYRKEFIHKQKINFAAGLFHEDCEWTAHWFPLCKRIGYLNRVFYYQVLSENSIMRGINLKKSVDLLTIAKLICKHAQRWRKEGDIVVYRTLQNYAAFETWSAIRSCVHQGYKIKKLITSEDVRQQILRQLYPNKRYRIVFLLIKLKLYNVLEMFVKTYVRMRGYT